MIKEKFTQLLSALRKKLLLSMNQTDTKFHTILYVVDGVLGAFLLYFIFIGIILAPFGYLKDFVTAVTMSIGVLLSVFLVPRGKTIFEYFKNLPLFCPVSILLFLLGLYFISFNYIWKKKAKYLDLRNL